MFGTKLQCCNFTTVAVVQQDTLWWETVDGCHKGSWWHTITADKVLWSVVVVWVCLSRWIDDCSSCCLPEGHFLAWKKVCQFVLVGILITCTFLAAEVYLDTSQFWCKTASSCCPPLASLVVQFDWGSTTLPLSLQSQSSWWFLFWQSSSGPRTEQRCHSVIVRSIPVYT